MSLNVNIERSDSDMLGKVAEALKKLNKYEVMVGVPDHKAARKGGSKATSVDEDEDETNQKKKKKKINNAELLFVHTNGSPVHGIPPRPVLEPAMKKHKDKVSASLKKAVDAAIRGDEAGVAPALEEAGLEGQNISRKYFVEANGWPANAEITIKGGLMRNKKSGKLVRVKGKKSTRPLIDTGEMRGSITYVVREV